MFAVDGMRPDVMERYASKGIIPTFKDLLKKGVAGDNGLLQGFPPNTGVGWHTLATGTWPGEHGSTNNTFHRTGDAFNNTSSFATPGILQADTLLQSAERAGKTVVAVEWVAARGLVPALQGPVIDFRTFIGGRGIALNFDLPGQPALANSFGVQYQRQELAAAAGWTNVPTSFSPAKEATFRHDDNRRRELGRLHLRLDQRLPRELRPGGRRQPERGQERRRDRAASARPVGRPQADADVEHGGALGENGRLLHEADRSQRRRFALPHLLHVRPARERDLQRARCGWIRRLRREARPRLPDLDRGRLRAARGPDRGRGHVRRARPEVG